MIKLKRRIGSAVLAVMMLLSLMPLTALAADTPVAKIGDTEYTSLQLAVNDVEDNTATTITLVNDIALTAPVTISSKQNITINGGGKKISFNFDASSCKVAFTGNSTTGEVEGIPSGVTLNINNVTFKNTNASVASSGYAVLVGGNSHNTAVSLNSCSFDNLYTAVYVNQQNSKDNAPKLSINNCTYSSTTYGYSIDETTVGAYKDAVQVTFPADSNKGVATEKEVWSNVIYVNDVVVSNSYNSQTLQTVIDNAAFGDTISLAPGEYEGDLVSSKAINLIGSSEGKTKLDNISFIGSSAALNNFRIANITFTDASNEKNLDTNAASLYLQNANNVLVENCVFTAPEDNSDTTIAVTTGYGSNITVDNCQISGYTISAYNNPDQSDISFTNNEISDCTSGIAFVGIDGITVTGNTFTNASGVRIEPSWDTGATKCENVTISQNSFNSIPEDGYAVRAVNSSGVPGYDGAVDASNNYFGENATPETIAAMLKGNVKIDTYYTDAGMTTTENIGGTLVATADQLKNAIANAKDGDTIVLANDIPDAKGISVPSGKNFTIDFAGHTYTLTGPGAGSTNTETNGFQLLKDSTITMKNGTIRIAENANNVKRIIQNYANLTLIDMQFYAKNQVDGEDYSLSFNNGNITFKGNTSIFTTSDDAIAFDVCQFSSYPSVNVVFDTDYTGTINGRILYDSPNAETHKLTIKGDGTFGRIDFTNSSGNAAKGAIDIYSGTFCESVSEYVVDTLKYELRGADGTFTYYETEEAALAAAQPGDVVVAIDNISKTEYTVTVKNGDQIVAQGTVIANGKYILPAAPSRAGYSFRGWYGNGHLYAANEAVQITKDTTFVAQWSDNTPYYTITVKDADNGTVTCYAKSAAKGADVTLNVKADVGYQLDKLTVTDASGKTVAVEKVNNTTYTFVMPGSKVTVEAVFVPTTVEPSGLPFTDVSTSDWFYGAVKFVYENGLMDGVGNNLFAPNATLNRAMAVTILYRLEGSPAVTTDAGFNDVAAGTWYTDAVNWAAANNIVNGVEGNNFDPTGSLTREQMATVLYRYAQYKGADVSASGDLSGFVDSANVSSWAADAVKWAVGSGLVNGVEGNALAPQGTSTRAQAATVLMRFVG